MKMFHIMADGTLGMSTYELIKLLIMLLAISAAGIGLMTVYKNARRKLNTVLNPLTSILGVASKLHKEGALLEEEPKSVSAMTKIFEPQIMRDFPEFSWEEFKHKSENMLISALLAISAENPERLTDGSLDIRKQVENTIADNRARGISETHSDITIYQTEIANYQKMNGKCIITIQSAVGSIYTKMQDGKLIKGDKKYKTQTKYNVELVYIQDTEKVSGNALGAVCPQCGAPIKTLGAKYCEYCGAGVTPINIRVWSLHKFYEVDYNQS